MSITLYDLPTKDPRQCWSLNVWTTRMCLAIKGIPYETEWLEFPDIKPFLQKQGVEAKSYTLPAIIDHAHNDKVVMDSLEIAKYLEVTYPDTPSLHLNSKFLPEFMELRNQLMAVFVGLVVTHYPDHLPERSKEYFVRTRTEKFGCSFKEREEQTLATPNSWENVAQVIEKLRAMLRANKGPFSEGKVPSFFDAIIVGIYLWVEIGNEEVYNRLREMGGKEVDDLLEEMVPYYGRKD